MHVAFPMQALRTKLSHVDKDGRKGRGPGEATVIAVIKFAPRFAHCAMRPYRGIRSTAVCSKITNEQRSLPHCPRAHGVASARRISRHYAAHWRRVLGHRACGPQEWPDLHQACIAQAESPGGLAGAGRAQPVRDRMDAHRGGHRSAGGAEDARRRPRNRHVRNGIPRRGSLPRMENAVARR